MDKETLIVADRITRYYGRRCAVDGVDFTVSRGEVVGLLGVNGAGKSTTMGMLCGVLAIHGGRVSIAGYDICQAPRSAKKHLGFLPEKPPLYPDMRVDDYLCYAARLRGLQRVVVKQAVEDSKRRTGLLKVGDRLIRHLSKGMRQRVGIAQAILHSPSAVVLDEPTAGLDPNQIVAIRELIRSLGDGHGVILSTHILSEVQSVCDRVLIIDQGRLVLNEPVATLLQSGEANTLEDTFVRLTGGEYGVTDNNEGGAQ